MPAFTMSRIQLRRRRAAVVAAASAGLLIAGILSVGSAQAAPSTKYYTATISPGEVDSGVTQHFTLTLTNCAKKTTGCTQASQQTLGSANIQVPAGFTVSPPVTVSSDAATGWSVALVNGVIELRSDNSTDLIPGSSLAIAVTATTPPDFGAYTWVTQVKQSNDFSGSGNDFTLSGSQPQVLVGFPDHLAFVTQPSTVQVNTDMSPEPSVQVVDAGGVAVTAGSADVTLAADTTHGDPGLGGYTSTAVDGLATFGSLTASNIGGGYQLQATATWTYGTYTVSLSTIQDSTPFDVVQVLTDCKPAGCSATTSGTHTTVNVTGGPAQSSDPLEIAIGVDQLQACPGFTAPNGLQVTRVLLDHHDKTITLTFDKYLVNQVPDNGTPLFTICFTAPWSWSDVNNQPVEADAVGVLPDCAPSLPAYNPCVQSRSKHAANEIVMVSVPYNATTGADPKLW